jgi:serine/threonine-protein kinase RsbW
MIEHPVISPNGQEPATVISVTLPADVRFLRVARLTAAGIAGDLGFGLQDVDDLRVAIDELCAVLIEGTPPTAELALRYLVDDDCLDIVGTCAGAGGPPELHPVAAELLRMTADSYELGGDGTTRSFRLVRRRHDATA